MDLRFGWRAQLPAPYQSQSASRDADLIALALYEAANGANLVHPDRAVAARRPLTRMSGPGDGSVRAPQLGDPAWQDAHLDQTALDHVDVQCTDLVTRTWWTAQ
ncbi:MAG: hypothetical protein JWO36_1843 [Myxococcales bacterium]|nr:hypothetical protein [Myxococcales bacterium]